MNTMNNQTRPGHTTRLSMTNQSPSLVLWNQKRPGHTTRLSQKTRPGHTTRLKVYMCNNHVHMSHPQMHAYSSVKAPAERKRVWRTTLQLLVGATIFLMVVLCLASSISSRRRLAPPPIPLSSITCDGSEADLDRVAGVVTTYITDIPQDPEDITGRKNNLRRFLDDKYSRAKRCEKCNEFFNVSDCHEKCDKVSLCVSVMYRERACAVIRALMGEWDAKRLSLESLKEIQSKKTLAETQRQIDELQCLLSSVKQWYQEWEGCQ